MWRKTAARLVIAALRVAIGTRGAIEKATAGVESDHLHADSQDHDEPSPGFLSTICHNARCTHLQYNAALCSAHP